MRGGRTTRPETYADRSTLSLAYEATTSRLKSTTDALGQTRTLTYAQDDRVIGVNYTGAVNPTPDVAFAWDAYFPRRTLMTDGTGTTSWSYAPVGSLGALQVAQESEPAASVSFAYDALGRLATRQAAGQGAETVAYDSIGRLSGDTNDLGAFTLGYLGQSGQIVSRALSGSSLATSWSYLPNAGDRRLAGIATTGLAAGQSTAFAFTSNAANEITGQSQTSDAGVGEPAAPLVQTASYNGLNQLTLLNSQPLTFDADGNLTSDGARTYAWDAENRLVAIGYLGQGGKATNFTYDGLGRRVAIASTPTGGGSATVTSYVWCGARPCQARNAAGTPSRGYYSEGEFMPGASVPAAYYSPDQLGSVRRVFTSAGAPGYDFDPYGAPLQATAPITDYGFAGTFNNQDSGLQLTPHRAYDPIAGRWLSRDPAGEATDPQGNLYAYVGGDPVNAVDPLGLATLQIGFGGSLNIPLGPIPVGISIPVSGGVAIDSQGNVGPYGSIGLGGQIGADVDAGLSVQTSNAAKICDLGKGFVQASVHAGAIAGGSLEYFGGSSPDGPVSGSGFTVGAAAGVSASLAGTYTFITPLGRVQ